MTVISTPIAAGQAIGVAAVAVAQLTAPFGGGQDGSGTLEAVCEVAGVPSLATVTVTFVGTVSGTTYGTRTFVNGAASAQTVSVNAKTNTNFRQFPQGEAVNINVSCSSAAGNTTAGYAASAD